MTTRRVLATLPVIALAGFLSLLDPDQDAALDPATTTVAAER